MHGPFFFKWRIICFDLSASKLNIFSFYSKHPEPLPLSKTIGVSQIILLSKNIYTEQDEPKQIQILKLLKSTHTSP